MLNNIILMGRLVADPELRSTQSGVAVCAFTIAIERDIKGPDGQKQTDFIDIVAWRQTAEFVSRYFAKGRMIVVKGSLQSRKWQDKSGNNRVSWEVQTDSVWFGDSKNPSGDNSASRFDSYTPPPETNYGHGDASTVSLPPQQASLTDKEFTPLPDDDLPF